jgi:branched-chain amino acid transport system substrate-binding protein
MVRSGSFLVSVMAAAAPRRHDCRGGHQDWRGRADDRAYRLVRRAATGMAVENLNAAGGVLGQNVELIVGDDFCDPDQAVAVARKLASDGVVFVAGHFCSHSSIPASKVYEEAGILQIAPGSASAQLTDEGGPNVFRTCGRDDRQGTKVGDYLAGHWADNDIAIPG